MSSVPKMSVTHFSRYGEFLASFELSKKEWNVYSPIYDEYIDIVAHKVICSNCRKKWELTPNIQCSKCNRVIGNTKKSSIGARKKCLDCGKINKGSKKCTKCKSKNLKNIPKCPYCTGAVELKKYVCSCGNEKYKSIFRTIQVKSSNPEYYKNGRPKSYGIDMKPRDLIEGKNHFFIWVCIDVNNIPHFLVLSVSEFKKTMGNSLNGISFLKDDDRQHPPYNGFGKWGKFENSWNALD